ncbi:NYN domain-containing protein [Candidatus Spongiihabitans sp.]|uniref:NYN domain-containing protein n=1 Tax=Candidatus Spongiihabitans sp. TaxID=3101308 RepID=UPI003C7E4BAE
MTKYRTCVYIDGFNFYHSIEEQIKDGICYYPSLRMLCKNILESIVDQEHILGEIHYCTALVESTKVDPTKLDRQKAYISALKDKDEDVKIHYGNFVWSRRLNRRVEKRSDVNLAVHLLNDAWLDKYNFAVIISGDADYLEAVRMVKKTFPGKPEKIIEVWAVGQIANDLVGAADKCRTITDTDLVRAKPIANFGFHPRR